MIYISNLTPMGGSKYKPLTIHFKPFDPQFGLSQSAEKLSATGYLVDGSYEDLQRKILSFQQSNPVPNSLKNYSVETYFDIETKQFIFEYEEVATQTTEDDAIIVLKREQGLLSPYANPSTLDEIRANKIYELSKACESEILAGFYSDCRGTREWFTNSRDDQSNIIAQASLTTLNPAIVPQWKSADESICTDFTLAQITQLATDGAIFKTDRIKTFETLKIQVMACTTIEEVQAISWAPKVWF